MTRRNVVMNQDSQENEQECPCSKDGNGHCKCWWDEQPCCWCGKGLEEEVSSWVKKQ